MFFFPDYFVDQNPKVRDALSVEVGSIKVNISRTRRLNQNSSNQYNDVKLSVLADIERASIVYDMRDLKEILEFPKIWYKSGLARRLFLGEESVKKNKSHSNRESQSPPPYNHHSNSPTPLLIKSSQSRSFEYNKKRQNNLHLASNWQTLVLVSINLSQLDVRMNVGNVLGQVK